MYGRPGERAVMDVSSGSGSALRRRLSQIAHVVGRPRCLGRVGLVRFGWCVLGHPLPWSLPRPQDSGARKLKEPQCATAPAYEVRGEHGLVRSARAVLPPTSRGRRGAGCHRIGAGFNSPASA
jgi:hypothetical protein